MSNPLPCRGPVQSKTTWVEKKRNQLEPSNWAKVKASKKKVNKRNPNTAIEDSDLEEESEDGRTGSTYLDQWEESLENIARLLERQPCNSLKQRQLGLLAAEVKRNVEERESQEERARLRVLEETRERWISLGMMKEEDAHLLESITGPYHPNIERSREEYFARKKEEDQRML